LDDKIALNRRTNQTLEALARAIFKSWFVDFDPVRAKAEGRRPEGMDDDTAKLFPDKFHDSPIGPVPAGWKVAMLPEAIDVNPQRVLRKGEPAPYLDMGNMPTTSARALAVETREHGSGMKFSNGDTLVARITPCLENGKTAFVDFLADGQVGWGSTEYIVLRPKPPLPVEFAYFLARTDEFRAHAIQNMTGTSGRQRVPASAFDAYTVVVPEASVATAFGAFASSAIRTMKQRDEESATLAALRDALLPKLLSGELSTVVA
jgi:type I restriction enzyme S subunit